MVKTIFIALLIFTVKMFKMWSYFFGVFTFIKIVQLYPTHFLPRLSWYSLFSPTFMCILTVFPDIIWSHVCVTIDRVWIGDWIYPQLHFVTTSYYSAIADSHTLQLTTAQDYSSQSSLGSGLPASVFHGSSPLFLAAGELSAHNCNSAANC
jgi:hypothetical protein